MKFPRVYLYASVLLLPAPLPAQTLCVGAAPTSTSPNERLGNRVAVDGSLLAATTTPAFTPPDGRVLVYERAAGAWEPFAELSPATVLGTSSIGPALDVDGTRLAVSGIVGGRGTVFVLERRPEGMIETFRWSRRTGSTWTASARR